MTQVILQKSPTNASDAYFRDWGSSYSAAIGTVGWIQTSDTGQINWTTVTMPTGINQSRGYEIWRMNDAMQSTYPVFMKIEYGSGSAINNPSIWVTLGTGTDGAGNLTGQVGSRLQARLNGTATSTYYGYVNGTTNTLLFAFCCGASGQSYYYAYSMMFCVERTWDASGNPTSEGAMLWMSSQSLPNSTQYVPFSGTIPSSYITYVNCVTPPTGTLSLGNNIYTVPLRVFGPGEISPFKSVMGYIAADLTALTPISLTNWDGSTITALPLGEINFISLSTIHQTTNVITRYQ